MTIEQAKEIVIKCYVAYFNRVVDKSGANYWINNLISNTFTTEEQLGYALTTQTEYKNIYTGFTRTQIIEDVYTRVLHRTPDASEVTYWNSGSVPTELLNLAIVNGATGNDYALLVNKYQVSEYAYNSSIELVHIPSILLSSVTTDIATVSALYATIDSLLQTVPSAEVDLSQVEFFSMRELTEGTLTGDGVFDKLMSAVNAHIDDQFKKTRIKDSDYATVYLGALQSTLNSSVQIVLAKDKLAQEQALLIAQRYELGLNGIADREIKTAQKDLYVRQEAGFDDNLNLKLFEAQLDVFGMAWSSVGGFGSDTDPASGLAAAFNSSEINKLYEDIVGRAPVATV